MAERLTEKQRRFVSEYLIDLNATAAAERAGYKDPNIGRQLITKNNVSKAIQEAIQRRERRTEITQDMVIRELAKLGFFDIRKLFDGNGKPLDISALDDDTAAALAGLDVQDVADSDGNYIGFLKKYKMADKIRALELLGKHLGAWEPKGKQEETGQLADLIDGLKEPVDDDIYAEAAGLDGAMAQEQTETD